MSRKKKNPTHNAIFADFGFFLPPLYHRHFHPFEKKCVKLVKKHPKNLEVGIKSPYLCTRKNKERRTLKEGVESEKKLETLTKTKH
jgi:hypothetical protein